MYAKKVYHDDHYAEHLCKEEWDGQNYAESARLLRIYLPAGTIVLDYGCGLGGFLLALRKQGFFPFGVELDEAAAQAAANRASCEVHSLDGFGRLVSVPQFDAIHLGDVLEHLPFPADTLRGLLATLKPNGILFVEGPLENNASLVYISAKAFGAVKRRLKPNYIGLAPPTHLFRVNSQVQKMLFSRIDERMELISWSVYETGWPYTSGSILKRAIAALARMLGGRRLLGLTFGNRFRGIFRLKATAP